jgi:hypothetical protein
MSQYILGTGIGADTDGQAGQWITGAGVGVHTASGGTDGTANGVTLTATASLIPGSAEGSSGSTANGATLTATASLITGSASGEANVTASGVTLTATASLIAGSASGQILGTLQFQAAGMEFGGRTGLEIDTVSLDAEVDYRYQVFADGLTLGSVIYTSGVLTTDTNGKLANNQNVLFEVGTVYRVHAIRQSDGEAATFRMTAV